ncbi:hypothetical protein AC37_1779 [Escherichia coli 6-175-07_S3_C2]|nr:hypothetical protein AC37_1779 [Escherichia coli 6-175-07_S3_C2]
MDTHISARLPLKPTRFTSASLTLHAPAPHFRSTPLHVNYSMQQQNGHYPPAPDADQCFSRVFICQMNPYA